MGGDANAFSSVEQDSGSKGGPEFVGIMSHVSQSGSQTGLDFGAAEREECAAGIQASRCQKMNLAAVRSHIRTPEIPGKKHRKDRQME